LNRRKQGFSIPLAAWLRGPLQELLRAHLSKQTLRDVGIFNVMAVEAMMNDHDRNSRNYETQLWTVLAFVAWHRRYMNAH
jgi:asparagine synthase (glutamine-hydrolysing)